MTETFNPYHKWLDIQPELRHPNYYELLHLSPRESDEDTIRTAAERAAARVRSFRPGDQAAAWARLLDEIAQAKDCLTDAAARAAYDQQLQSPHTSATAETADQSPEPEIASVNQDANLYPPGAVPPATQPPSDRVKKPAAPAVGSREAKPNPKTAQRTSQKPSSAAKHPRPAEAGPARSAASKPVAPKSPVPASTVKPSAKQKPKRKSSSKKPNPSPIPPDVPEPDSTPVNAHVAPPPEEKPSQWLLLIPVTVVIVLLTLLVLYVAIFAGT